MAGKLKLVAGLAAGYVLGARAGRERYERIAEATRRLAERPEVRELTGKVRAGLGAGLEKAASTASDRLQEARGEDSDSEGQTRATSDRSEATERPPGSGKPPQVEVGEPDRSGREGGGAPPEPGPTTGGRERSRSGR